MGYRVFDIPWAFNLKTFSNSYEVLESSLKIWPLMERRLTEKYLLLHHKVRYCASPGIPVKLLMFHEI